MSERVRVGVYHEKRGEDRYTVYKSGDGDVVQIEHFDARAAYSKYQSVNLWSDEAPALIKLIEKAAGIKKVPVKYEYAIVQKDESNGMETLVTAIRIWNNSKPTQQALAQKFNETAELDEDDKPLYTYKVVRREVPKSYEYVKE